MNTKGIANDDRPRCAWVRLAGGTCSHKATHTVTFADKREAQYCDEHSRSLCNMLRQATRRLTQPNVTVH